jgi:hypothetical protein
LKDYRKTKQKKRTDYILEKKQNFEMTKVDLYYEFKAKIDLDYKFKKE